MGRSSHRCCRSVLIRACARSAAAVLVALTAGGCSVVFDAAIEGQVVDRLRYEDTPDDAGIDAVEVYLYLNDRGRDRDLESYTTDGLLPDESGEDRYFLRTITDTGAAGQAGAFAFANILWHDLLPRFGRSGDRREIFFLLYRPDYGLAARNAFVVSGTTNRIAPFEIDTLLTFADITGNVVDSSTGEGIDEVMVSVYVPTAYADGAFVYPQEPDHELTTAGDGSYSGQIDFSRELAADRGGVVLLLTFDQDDYQARAGDDSDLAADRDIDGDGSDDTYASSSNVLEGSETEMPEIELRRVGFDETLYVQVGTDPGDGFTGTNGAVVALYFDRSSAPGASEEPDFQTTTTIRLVADGFESGWATFDNLTWTDTAYTGAQSSIQCYVDIDHDADGIVDADNIATTVVSNAENTVLYEY